MQPLGPGEMLSACPCPGHAGYVPGDQVCGCSSVLWPALTKPSACFLCLPVDRPPMEPSQFVSVVPKHPDKMGFDEVGKAHVCKCVTCLYVYIGSQA